MRSILISLLTATLGTVGFSILFYIRPRRLPLAALGGLLSCGVYLLCKWWLGGELIPNLLAAFIGAMYSEVCARLTKVPVSVYTTPCIVPLVPGGMLYRTMSCFVRGDMTGAGQYGLTTLTIALGISGGIVAASILAIYLHPRKKRKRS